ncbi:MAG: THUMP domain-containing protein [Candidatus Methanomethylophilus sp.]|nr:THUMP domain-containing protein [Methanomethylophilus sp.]MDD3232694.1 THUMP domain-containing protein [Methanomethylophilus sp.]MDD4221538.1 THUMP domain-containing protein [Methanomethylophilus sp.]MDD4668367.1 THUMP domain-containing protein [Methanomethylophilus sp.]
MAVLLVRYSEIGLKSTPVRVRFENRLKDNLLQMLMADGVEALVNKGEARFYIEATDLKAAIRSVRKVFGVASISVAETCGPDLPAICAAAAAYSQGRMVKGKTFAVRARREGGQKFTSMDVGREAGSAIWDANLDKDPRVDLTSPDVVFYIEVRPKAAYIFSDYIYCHAGLPIGTQGRVIADVDDDRGLVSAWLMMKRGCKVLVRGSRDPTPLRIYDPTLKIITSGEVPPKTLGYVKGWTLANLPAFDASKYALPVYFPTIGMDDAEVSAIMQRIAEESS